MSPLLTRDTPGISRKPPKTRATMEVHDFFSEVSQFGSLRLGSNKTYFELKKKLLSDEKSHGLGTQREPCKKMAQFFFFPTILG